MEDKRTVDVEPDSPCHQQSVDNGEGFPAAEREEKYHWQQVNQIPRAELVTAKGSVQKQKIKMQENTEQQKDILGIDLPFDAAPYRVNGGDDEERIAQIEGKTGKDRKQKHVVFDIREAQDVFQILRPVCEGKLDAALAGEFWQIIVSKLKDIPKPRIIQRSIGNGDKSRCNQVRDHFSQNPDTGHIR